MAVWVLGGERGLNRPAAVGQATHLRILYKLQSERRRSWDHTAKIRH
jgi:hypothetical protein